MPLVVESKTVWTGVVTPVWVLNVSCGGVAITVVCASAVSKQHSVATISPNENSRGPLFFKTYSKEKGFTPDRSAQVGGTRSRGCTDVGPPSELIGFIKTLSL